MSDLAQLRPSAAGGPTPAAAYVRMSTEERVLDAVLHGRLPITIAVQIAGEDDEAAQRMLVEAYEKKAMKQSTLRAFRRLLDQRKCFGKG